MLSIFTLAYADRPTTVPQRQVFAAYVEQMFKRRGAEAPYIPEQTQHWLACLATQMTRNSLTVFYIEEIQPDWLPSHHQQWLLRIGRSIVVGLVVGLVVGFIKGGHTCI
jgi:hypothetical protein